MSEKTFQRGLKELLEKRFLWARSPTSFWTNPALFFKGDRVLFIKEYRRRKPQDDLEKDIAETMHLQSSPANAQRLDESIEQLRGRAKVRRSIDLNDDGENA
jgi:hypothetical protein